mgnify:CR=1 FL=1
MLNSKYPDVIEWIKQFVDFDKEYVKADRNSCIVFGDDSYVPYPIENHVYLLPKYFTIPMYRRFLVHC